jgi:hypothetical protein
VRVSSRDTLRTLVAVSRSKPTERELCCPDCGGRIELSRGLYCCVSFGCGGNRFETLAELAVREAPLG